jgi:hypothetical protein
VADADAVAEVEEVALLVELELAELEPEAVDVDDAVALVVGLDVAEPEREGGERPG